MALKKLKTALETRTTYHQLRALVLKTLTLYSRQKVSLAVTLLFPILLLLFVALLQVIVDNIAINLGEDQLINVTQPLNFVPVQLGMNTTFEYYFAVDATAKPPPDIALSIGNLTQYGGNGAGLLGQLSSFQQSYTLQNGTTVQVPFFVSQPSLEDAERVIDDTERFLYSSQDSFSHNEKLNTLLPDGVFVLKDVDYSPNNGSSTLSISYQLMYNDVEAFERNPAGRIKYRFPSLIQTIIIKTVELLSVGNSTPGYPMVILNNLPYIQRTATVKLIDIAGLALFPFAVSFLTPIYMNKIVLEKETKLRILMKLCGMKMRIYWAICYIFDLLLYIATTLLFSIAEVISGARFFKETGPGILVTSYLLWGFAQISVSYFFASFIKRTRTATVAGYLIVIVCIAGGEVLFATIYMDSPMPAIFHILPLFSFFRAIYLIWVLCYGNAAPGQFSSFFACPTSLSWDDELAKCLFAMGIQAPLYLIAALLIDTLIESPSTLTKCCRPKRKSKWSVEMDNVVDIESNDRSADEGVRQEDKLANSDLDLSQYGIVIRNLCKVYPGRRGSGKDATDAHNRKYAVDHLNLTIRNGECFALLGENGAGKTTTISILTGLLTATSGDAFVGGYSVRDSMSQIHKIVGVCMQFDTLWPTLTCEEHLLFFTRLKGTVPPNEELEHVHQILKLFELDGDKATRPSAKLSGGMRRRLSVAIALAGDSKVIFLDEPSGGLDVGNRRLLWKIISKFTRDKCVILTTHSMEEADTLCDRVGVMSRGKLVCVGQPLHLKKQYGSGYKLKIAYNQLTTVKQVKEFIKELLPFATLQTRYNSALVFQIPDENIDAALKAIPKLDEAKRDGKAGITDWELNQASLEDVFLNVIKRKTNRIIENEDSEIEVDD